MIVLNQAQFFTVVCGFPTDTTAVRAYLSGKVRSDFFRSPCNWIVCNNPCLKQIMRRACWFFEQLRDTLSCGSDHGSPSAEVNVCTRSPFYFRCGDNNATEPGTAIVWVVPRITYGRRQIHGSMATYWELCLMNSFRF